MSQIDWFEVNELMIQAEDLPFGPSCLRFAEEALQRAEASQDLDLVFRTKVWFVQLANFSGRTDQTLVTLTWCLGQFDRDPLRFAQWEEPLLWRLKWVLQSIGAYPNIPLERIESLRADADRRYTEGGYGARILAYMQYCLFVSLGWARQAEEQYHLFRTYPRDDLSDCHACEISESLNLFEWTGRDEELVRLAQPVLDGTLDCAEEPHITYSKVLRPLVRLGRLEEAARYHRRGYRLIRSNMRFLPYLARHVFYLLAIGNRAKAKRLLEHHSEWVARSTLPRDVLFYFFAMKQFLAGTRRTRVSMKLHPSFLGHDPSGDYDAKALVACCDREIDRLATAFDDRNGNDFYTSLFPRWMEYGPPMADGSAGGA